MRKSFFLSFFFSVSSTFQESIKVLNTTFVFQYWKKHIFFNFPNMEYHMLSYVEFQKKAKEAFELGSYALYAASVCCIM